MSWTFIVVYVHVVGAILLVGYCLFWAVMTTATRREFENQEADRLLGTARSAAWPLPGRKLPLTLIGWLLLIGVSTMGIFLLPQGFTLDRLIDGDRFSTLLLIKGALIVVLATCFPRLGRSRIPLALTAVTLALAVIVASTMLAR